MTLYIMCITVLQENEHVKQLRTYFFLFLSLLIHTHQFKHSPDSREFIKLIVFYNTIYYVIFHYIIYRLCGPLKAAIDKMHVLKREIEENERVAAANEEQVYIHP